MKVTQSSTYRLMNTNLDRITNTLQDLRNQGASGLKINKPSDDPTAIRPILTTRTEIRHTERYLDTMGVSFDKMQATDSHLEHVENILQRVKEIGINSVNGSLSAADLQTLADEVGQLKEELVSAANTKLDGKFLFAGYSDTTQPFVINGSYTDAGYLPNDSNTWPYIYQGDQNPTELEITPGERVQVSVTGNELFLGVADANWSPPPAANQSEPGNVDLFSVLTRIEAAIRANNVDDPAGAGGGIQANIENLEIAANQERRIRAQLGTRTARIEEAIAQQEKIAVDLQQTLSRYQDADAIETFNEIIKQETAFQAALNVTSRISQISILDYF